jgi:hypothetical protein
MVLGMNSFSVAVRGARFVPTPIASWRAKVAFHKSQQQLPISVKVSVSVWKRLWGIAKGFPILFIEALRSHWISNSNDSLLSTAIKPNDPPVVFIRNVVSSLKGSDVQVSYSWFAVLKSPKPSSTRFVIVFSPSRTQTRGSKYFLFGLSSPSGFPTCCIK